MKDVFVSHSSKDKKVADALVHYLEGRGIACWVAPRDIASGTPYAEGIIEGLTGSMGMVLIFSNVANESPHVQREVERCVNLGLPIIPFRIKDTSPTGGMDYFISSLHWIDAFDAPVDSHFERVATRLWELLPEDDPRAGSSVNEPVVSVEPTSSPFEESPRKNQTRPKLWLIVTVILILVGALFLTKTFSFSTKQPSAADTPPGKSSPSQTEPFVNTLGMRFVPLPVTGGVAEGRSILLSIWETRRRDYAPFVIASGADWERADWVMNDFVETQDHPVVCVSQQDAEEFCKWLTEREREVGHIPDDAQYRLPRDHEWSCAVGIGDLEDPTESPEAKSEKYRGYPWGTQWPPPEGAGNYLGEEGSEVPQFDEDYHPIIGFRDLFPRTAPVGSFPPNELGLFDLGGNVNEWCREKSDEIPNGAILRGGCWLRKHDNDLSSQSSRRTIHREDIRIALNGFRVALEMPNSEQ